MVRLKYYIYKLTVGKAIYVGKTIQHDPDHRLNQHLKLLKEGRHHTDYLQEQWDLTKKINHSIIQKGNSLFKLKVALLEQRAIDKYSNCNESKAAKSSKYSRKEFCFDVIDFCWKYHKFLLVLLFLVVTYLYSNLS